MDTNTQPTYQRQMDLQEAISEKIGNTVMISAELARAAIIALDCLENLLGDYARGALRGGQMDWEDVDATFEAAKAHSLNLYNAKLREFAQEYYCREDWKYDVENGDTKLGYEEWLIHQIESAEG